MAMFVEAIDREVDDLCANGIRLRFIGDAGRLRPELVARMRAAEAQAAGNSAHDAQRGDRLRRSLGHRRCRSRAGASLRGG